jgi:hypothetical protein
VVGQATIRNDRYHSSRSAFTRDRSDSYLRGDHIGGSAAGTSDFEVGSANHRKSKPLPDTK